MPVPNSTATPRTATNVNAVYLATVDNVTVLDQDAVLLDRTADNRPHTERIVPLQISRSPSLTSSQETSGVAVACVTEDKVQNSLFLPSLYVFNAASLVKPHAVEQISAELIGYNVDVAVVCETDMKKKHADSVVQIPE